MNLLKSVIFFFFINLLNGGLAQATTPLLDLGQIIKLGQSESMTLSQLQKSGIRFEKMSIDSSGGFSKALTLGPGLLALLNKNNVNHQLLDVNRKPSFLLLYQHSRIGVIALMEGRVHSYMLAISDADVKPAKNPFEYSRLKKLNQQLSYLKSLCRRTKSDRAAVGGQKYEWTGFNCSSGGNAYIYHQPGYRYPLTLLAYP